MTLLFILFVLSRISINKSWRYYIYIYIYSLLVAFSTQRQWKNQSTDICIKIYKLLIGAERPFILQKLTLKVQQKKARTESKFDHQSIHCSYHLDLLQVLKLKKFKRNWLGWFLIFELISCKFIRLNLCVLFGIYQKLN
jgi:hypothetical protein